MKKILFVLVLLLCVTTVSVFAQSDFSINYAACNDYPNVDVVVSDLVGNNDVEVASVIWNGAELTNTDISRLKDTDLPVYYYLVLDNYKNYQTDMDILRNVAKEIYQQHGKRPQDYFILVSFTKDKVEFSESENDPEKLFNARKPVSGGNLEGDVYKALSKTLNELKGYRRGKSVVILADDSDFIFPHPENINTFSGQFENLGVSVYSILMKDNQGVINETAKKSYSEISRITNGMAYVSSEMPKKIAGDIVKSVDNTYEIRSIFPYNFVNPQRTDGLLTIYLKNQRETNLGVITAKLTVPQVDYQYSVPVEPQPIQPQVYPEPDGSPDESEKEPVQEEEPTATPMTEPTPTTDSESGDSGNKYSKLRQFLMDLFGEKEWLLYTILCTVILVLFILFIIMFVKQNRTGKGADVPVPASVMIQEELPSVAAAPVVVPVPEPQKVSKPALKLFLTEEGKSQTIAINLEEGKKLIFGRGSNADVRLNAADQTISRIHFSMLLQNGVVLLTDEGSTGGTIYNGNRMTRSQQVHTNSILTVGQTTYRVTFDESSIGNGQQNTDSGKTKMVFY